MKKAAFHNLGCKVNSYETEAMQQILEREGYEIVPFQEGADVYVVNTCSVTNIADRKSRQMLHRARKMNPGAVVVAVGCYVQAAGEELKADPAVDLVIGNNKKAELAHILREYLAARDVGEWQAGREHLLDIGAAGDYEELGITDIVGHTRAFIKVQDGCNQFCSYCIIPYTRGRVRSRRPEKVEQEVRGLAARGYQEVVLTGIHLSSYGTDFQEESQEGLLGLIKRLHGIEGIARIRLGSLEPRIVTDGFVCGLASLPKVCPHFHLSLQSGCDGTLQRMNRHYGTEEYRRCCERLRAAYDRPAITTDVIVGFPGETGEEFAMTRDYLSDIGFYEMHVFKYSKRAGTRAAKMDGQVSEHEKARRSDILLELGKEMSRCYRCQHLGDRLSLLLEEEEELDGCRYMVGHTREYIRMAAPAGCARPGEVLEVEADGFIHDEIMKAGKIFLRK